MEWIMEKILPLFIFVMVSIFIYGLVQDVLPNKFKPGDFAYMRDDCTKFLVMRSDKIWPWEEDLIVSDKGNWHNFSAEEFVKTPAECAKW